MFEEENEDYISSYHKFWDEVLQLLYKSFNSRKPTLKISIQNSHLALAMMGYMHITQVATRSPKQVFTKPYRWKIEIYIVLYLSSKCENLPWKSAWEIQSFSLLLLLFFKNGIWPSDTDLLRETLLSHHVEKQTPCLSKSHPSVVATVPFA